MNYIVGTAGHIDHGKTALVRALTGTDTDRLPEEKKRGITVDLGFAEMSVGGTRFGFVDVPGHERFVKNMLAGASGIDLVILVVAADEGVMPQTREHFDICRLLGIRGGIVALTKADLVDSDTLELARMSVEDLVAGTFLDGAPIVSVSSLTLSGLDELKADLAEAAAGLAVRRSDQVMRMPIDRSFSVKGFGAVVTGTLVSGQIAEGDEVELLPSGRTVRVRAVQTHGEGTASATAGNRVAVNLGGIDHSKVSRGMLLAEPGALKATQAFDALVEVLATAERPLRARQRVRLHIGAAEVLARLAVLDPSGELQPGAEGFAQLRLEHPIAVPPGERFVIRSYSPQLTIAGGRVIDPFAARHRAKDLPAVTKYLAGLGSADQDNAAKVAMIVEASGASGCGLDDLRARTALKGSVLADAVDAGVASGALRRAASRVVSAAKADELAKAAFAELLNFHGHEPLAKGMPRELLREQVFRYLPVEIYHAVIAAMIESGDAVAEHETVRLASHRPEASPEVRLLIKTFTETFDNAGLEVPKLNEILETAAGRAGVRIDIARRHFERFMEGGEIVKVSDEFYFKRAVIDELAAKMRRYAAGRDDRSIDVAAFKEISGTSRKYAIPLLEYFDRQNITMRSGERRTVL